MALGAENVQAAEGDDFVVLGFALVRELIVDGLPLAGGNLKNFAFVLEKDHGNGGLPAVAIRTVRADNRGGGGVRHGQLVLQKVFARQEFRIAAEQNVGSATGHVGGHGDGAFASSLGDDARFTLVLLGVEHLVRDAGFLQNFRDGFGFLDGNRADQHGLAALVKMADAVSEGIVFLHNAVDDGFEFFFFGAIDDVRILFAD